MELTNTHMRYLVAIYCLTRTQEEVSSLDIAGFLGVKKASVSRMTPVLMKKQLLVKEKYGKVYLTGKGYRLAKQMVQQIEQLSDLIRGALPLSEPEVWTAACAAACALAEQRQANPPGGTAVRMKAALGRAVFILAFRKGGAPMKQHRFWAWAALACMAMAMFTGMKHK